MDIKELAYRLHMDSTKLRIIRAALEDRSDDKLSHELFLVEDSLNTISHELLNAKAYDLTTIVKTEE
mgnify:CR=1 FL=1